MNLELTNPSSEINNAEAKVTASGGESPYTYKWSNQETSLESSKSKGLIEGMPHTVIVTDAAGESVEKTFEIEAESITEIFNSGVQPAVDF